MHRKIDAQTHRYTLQFAWSLQELLLYLVSSRLPIHGSPRSFRLARLWSTGSFACLCSSVFWLLCVVHSALPRVLCLSICVAIGLPLGFLRRLPWEFISRLRQESNLVSLLFSQHAAVKSLFHYCNGLVVCLLAAVFWSSARRCFCVSKFRSSPSFSSLALSVLRFCFPFPVHPSLPSPPTRFCPWSHCRWSRHQQTSAHVGFCCACENESSEQSPDGKQQHDEGRRRWDGDGAYRCWGLRRRYRLRLIG